MWPTLSLLQIEGLARSQKQSQDFLLELPSLPALETEMGWRCHLNGVWFRAWPVGSRGPLAFSFRLLCVCVLASVRVLDAALRFLFTQFHLCTSGYTTDIA